jgi:hypothetical protein
MVGYNMTLQAACILVCVLVGDGLCALRRCARQAGEGGPGAAVYRPLDAACALDMERALDVHCSSSNSKQAGALQM